MPFLDERNSASLLILSIAFGLTLIVIVMYVLWQKFRIIKRKRSNTGAMPYDSKEELNITTLTMSRHMSYPNTDIPNTNDDSFKSYNSYDDNRNPEEPPLPEKMKGKMGSVTPPPPARSFSGQLDIKKVPPHMRQLSKINSQIIMFNGHPHIQNVLHRRFSKIDILETPR